MVGALVAGMVVEAGYKMTGEVKFDERTGAHAYAGSVKTEGAFWGLLPFGWDGKSGGLVMVRLSFPLSLRRIGSDELVILDSGTTSSSSSACQPSSSSPS